MGWSVTLLCAAYPGSPREARRHDVRYLYRGSKVTVYLRGLLYTLLHRPDHVSTCRTVSHSLPASYVVPGSSCSCTTCTRSSGRSCTRAGVADWAGGWSPASRPALYRDCRYVTVSSASRDELVRPWCRPGAHRRDPQRHRPCPASPASPQAACADGGLRRADRAAQAGRARGRRHRRSPEGAARRATASSSALAGGRTRCAPYVETRGLQDAVEFRGHVSEADKHAAYDEAWVLALPSLKEGWGLVVGEAAAHGVPTVAYRSAGGPTESVQDEALGLLVDDPAEFSSAITGAAAGRESSGAGCRPGRSRQRATSPGSRRSAGSTGSSPGGWSAEKPASVSLTGL